MEVDNLRRRRRKKILNSKSTMFIITIIALSSIGMGYGAWNEGLNIDVSAETGNLDLRFASEDISEYSDMRVDSSSDGKTLHISGEVVGGYSGSVYFEVENIGTVPAVLTNEREVIFPNQSKYFSVPIEIEYFGGPSSVSLETSMTEPSMMVQPIESEEDIEIIVDEMINSMYQVENYFYTDTYYIEQGF